MSGLIYYIILYNRHKGILYKFLVIMVLTIHAISTVIDDSKYIIRKHPFFFRFLDKFSWIIQTIAELNNIQDRVKKKNQKKPANLFIYFFNFKLMLFWNYILKMKFHFNIKNYFKFHNIANYFNTTVKLFLQLHWQILPLLIIKFLQSFTRAHIGSLAHSKQSCKLQPAQKFRHIWPYQPISNNNSLDVDYDTMGLFDNLLTSVCLSHL